MRQLVVGLGQCGRNISETLARSFIDGTMTGGRIFNTLVDQKRIESIVLTDIAEFKKSRDLEHLKGRLSVRSHKFGIGRGGGVGSDWNLARYITEKNFPSFFKQILRESVKTVEHINLIHSCGGGTGAGGGPVVARRLVSEEKELVGEKRNRLLLTSTLILPHEPEERKKKNAAITISRYYGLVDGIILVDNSIWKRLPIDFISIPKSRFRSADTFSVINELLVLNLKWMNVTDEILSGSLPIFKATKTYEALDFRNMFLDDGNIPTGIIVPGYAEYDMNTLEYFTISMLILHTLAKSLLADVDWTKPFNSLIIFVGFPSILKMGKGKYSHLSKGILSFEDLIPHLRKFIGIPPDRNIDIVYIYSSALRNKIAIAVWVVHPYIEKLISLANLVLNVAEKSEKEEAETLYETGERLIQLWPYIKGR